MKYEIFRIKRKRLVLLLDILHKSVIIKGPLGCLVCTLPRYISILSNKSFFIGTRTLGNSFYAKITQYIQTLLYGTFVTIKPEGVGFRFRRHFRVPQALTLSLGHTHTIICKLPKSVHFRCQKYRLLLCANRYNLLSNMANAIRGYRPPDAYKGKV
jgi:ribosomal protein L6P/L9E